MKKRPSGHVERLYCPKLMKKKAFGHIEGFSIPKELLHRE